ncbi:hypothetical protein V5O48_008388 [Marasmius crinis-equi]|uniref:C2 domain-containing protein n=1 Tax=Marasmius crinis-equi TaxID=585013 RepID=A0ABR3FE75_9AGAR
MVPKIPLSSPYQRASFSVSSRLISCLVTESLLRAYYLPLPPDACEDSPNVAGVMVVLSTSLISEQPVIVRALKADDVFAIVPLHSIPVLKTGPSHRHGHPIGLVDPLDMLPEIYELDNATAQNAMSDFQKTLLRSLAPPPWVIDSKVSLSVVTGPDALWRKFLKDMFLHDSVRTTIENELMSSLHWQSIAFEKPPRLPSLTSPSIEWEQSLVSGHPTHPMHRARMLPSAPTDYDWYTPTIRFVKVPRKRISLQGPFVDIIQDFARTTEALKSANDDEHILMPVHELQVDKIASTFPDVEVLPPEASVQALGQASIRTVVIPHLPGKALKLAVGVKISSSLRTISHFTADFGPRFSNDIVPKLSINPDILTIEREPASAVYQGVDPDVAKHFTAVIRDVYEPKPGENVIICAALLDWGHSGIPEDVSAVEHIFELDTELKRRSFLDRYIRIICEALIPPLAYNGVAFEAHAQNLLARFDTTSGELLGFVVRDLGGLRVHPETLRASTGVDFQFLPEHCVVTRTVEDAYPKLYHTLVHNHLQRLIRLLDMHHNGVGWEMLRKHLTAVIPPSHGLHATFMDPVNDLLPGKCLMRMKLQGVYRDSQMSAEEEIGTLIVVVLKARNLNDKHFYKQDVYATISLNGVKKRTKVDAKGGQHPVWDDELRFPVMKNTSAKHRKLEAQCWSKEHKDDDMLGEGTLDITETLKTGEFDEWVPLQIEGVQRGDIYLEMTFYSNGPAPAPAPAPAPSVTAAPKNNLAVPVNLQRRPSKLSPAERLSRIPQGLKPNIPNPNQRPNAPQKTPPRTPPKNAYSALPPVAENNGAPAPGNLRPGPGYGRPQSSLQPSPASGQPQRIPTILRPANPKSAPEPKPSHSAFVSASTPEPSQQGYPQSNGPSPYGTGSQVGFPTHSHPTSSTPGYQTHNSNYAPPPAGPSDAWPANQQYNSQPQAAPMSFSFPVPDIAGPVSPPPSSTPYDQYHGHGGNYDYDARRYSTPSPAPPSFPSHNSHSNTPSPAHAQTGSSGDLPDPYLIARYQTPLPLPPGAEHQSRSSPVSPAPPQPQLYHTRTASLPDLPPPTPPSPVRHQEPPSLNFPSPSSPPPSVPVRQPTPIDEERIRALRQAEIEAARRRQQEEDDAELARQLDRDLAAEHQRAPPPPPRKSPSPVREDPAVIARRLREKEEARRREQEEKDLELARQLDRELNLAEANGLTSPRMPGGL